MLLWSGIVLLTIAYLLHQYVCWRRISRLEHLHGDVFICHCANGRKVVARLESDSIFNSCVFILRFKSLAGYREVSYVVLRGTRRWHLYGSLRRLLLF